MTDELQGMDRVKVEQRIARAVARLQAAVLGLVFGLVMGVGLFAMTAILVIDGGPFAGRHLNLLGEYFWGYSVTWPGAVIGFVWAFFTGVAIGGSIGLIYNRVVGIRHG